MDFSTGKRVVITGMGNVAIDIAHWLLEDSPYRPLLESVVVIARRGPVEAKFDEKEIEYVEWHIARDEMIAELARVKERCARCNQDVSPEKLFEQHFRKLKNPDFTSIPPRLSFRFLTSPTAILKDEDGRIARIEAAENDLVLREDGSTKSVATKERTIIEADTLIFAIGDKQRSQYRLADGPARVRHGAGFGLVSRAAFQTLESGDRAGVSRPLCRGLGTAGEHGLGWNRAP